MVDNPLTSDPTDFRAAVQSEKSVDDAELLEMILHRSTGIAKSDVLRILDEYGIALCFFLAKGRSINTSLLNAFYSVSGVFTSEEDRFEPSRHELNLNIKPGISLREVLDQVTIEKVEASDVSPSVKQFFDTESGTKNEQLTPGEPGKLAGKRLKFDMEDPAQGVFFIDSKKKELKVEKYVECNPSKLIFKIPANLVAGTYKSDTFTLWCFIHKHYNALIDRTREVNTMV